MARLKTAYEQSCAYCHSDFVPRKRGTQRFCSASCRTTYCRKKREGTLGRVTKLRGLERGLQRGSFAETALASATGALAANAVSQTAEYFAVTRGLVQQVDQLTHLVQQLIKDQANSAKQIGRGTLTVLTKLGASKAEALEAISTPFFSAATSAQPPNLAAPKRAVLSPPTLPISLAMPPQAHSLMNTASPQEPEPLLNGTSS